LKGDSQEVSEIPGKEGKAKTKAETDLEIVKIEKLAEMLESGLSTAGSITKELLRAAMNNPMLGLVVSLMLSDMLVKSGVMQKETGWLIKGIIVSAAGVDIAGDIIGLVTRVLPFAPPVTKNNELFTPRAETIVFADGGAEDIKALLTRIGKK